MTPRWGPADFKIKGIDFKFYSRRPSAIYRFTDDPSEDDMKRFMNKAIDEMAAETIGQGEWVFWEARLEAKCVWHGRLVRGLSLEEWYSGVDK